MFTRKQRIDPSNISDFQKFTREKGPYALGRLSQFYASTITPILRQPSLSYSFSPSLSQLASTLRLKFQEDPHSSQQICPDIQTIIKALALFIHPSYQYPSQQLRGVSSKSPAKQREEPQKEEKEKEIKKEDVFTRNNEKDEKEEPRLKCLGCSQFFLHGESIVKEGITETPAIVLPSIKKIRSYEPELKQGLGGIVNGNGGVVLFGCVEEKNSIVARGELISENSKESILQQLGEVFDSFIPKLTFSNNAHLSYVPVSDQGPDLRFRPGMFVTRLRLWNNSRYNLFFWLNSGQLCLSLPSEEQKGPQLKIHQLSGKEAIKRWKWSFKENYIPGDWDKPEQVILHKPHCFGKHECFLPLLGCNIASEKDEKDKYVDQYSLEEEHPYVSVVILNKIPLNKVVGFLIAQKITHFEFKSPNPSIVSNKDITLLFHNTSPYKLKQIFERMEFNQRKSTFLMIDTAVLIKKRLTLPEFLQLRTTVLQLRPGQQVSYFEYQDRNREAGILEARSRVSIFFLFMLLKRMGFIGSKFVKVDKEMKFLFLVFDTSTQPQ